MKIEIKAKEDEYIFAEIIMGGNSRIFRLGNGLTIDRENKSVILKGSVDFDSTKKAEKKDFVSASGETVVENYDSFMYSIKKFIL